MAAETTARIVDLKERLKELKKKGAPYRNGFRLDLNDLRYAIAEDLETIYDVELALELEMAE